jgi:hypothetical protein
MCYMPCPSHSSRFAPEQYGMRSTDHSAPLLRRPS